MTEEIKGVLSSVNWTLGRGSCSVHITGHGGLLDFHGDPRMVGNILEEGLVSIGDTVIATVDSIGLMTSIRRAPVCSKCGGTDVEEEKIKDLLCWTCLCAACGHSWIEE